MLYDQDTIRAWAAAIVAAYGGRKEAARGLGVGKATIAGALNRIHGTNERSCRKRIAAALGIELTSVRVWQGPEKLTLPEAAPGLLRGIKLEGRKALSDTDFAIALGEELPSNWLDEITPEIVRRLDNRDLLDLCRWVRKQRKGKDNE